MLKQKNIVVIKLAIQFLIYDPISLKTDTYIKILKFQKKTISKKLQLDLEY